MSDIENIINAADRVLEKVEKSAIVDINNALGEAFKLLEDKFIASYEKGLDSEKEYMIKLRVMIQELDAVLNLVNPNNTYYRDRLLEVIQKASDLGVNSGAEIFKAVDPEAKPINARLNIEALAFTADRAAERLSNYSASFRATTIQVIGANLAIGSSSNKTARQLRNTLEMTKGTAERLVRTESIRALNLAAENFYAENGVDYVQIFATADERVCPYCAARNQSIYRRGSISLPLHPHCFPGDTLVSGSLASSASRRKYRGEVITIQTASGNKLTGTPNHPILTSKGWVGLQHITEGMHVLSAISSDRVSNLVNPNNYQAETTIKEVFSLINKSSVMSSTSMPVSPEDFHNDGRGSKQFNIVSTDRVSFNGQSSSTLLLPGLDTSVKCLMCGGGSSDFDTSLTQSLFNRFFVDSVAFSEALLSFPGVVQLDQVVHVDISYYSGHVYNLETLDNWYTANNIIVHNCRCFVSPVKPEWLKRELIDKDFSERYYAETLDKLKSLDKDLNRGAAPFERLNGLLAPTPVWQPGAKFPNLKVSVSKTKSQPKPQKDPLAVDTGSYKDLIKLGDNILNTWLKPALKPYYTDDVKNAEKELNAKEKKLKEVEKKASDIFKVFNASKDEGANKLLPKMLTLANQRGEIEANIVQLKQYLKINYYDPGMRDFKNNIIKTVGMSKQEADNLASQLNISVPTEVAPASQLREIYSEVIQLTGGKGLPTLKNITYDDPRAYAYEPAKEINVGQKAKPQTQFHEYGHHMEFSDIALKKAMGDWIRDRATAPRPEKLSTLIPGAGYSDNETAYPDKFISPYVGKIYEDLCTEVLSMGLEHFHNPSLMSDLYDKDLDHFKLTVGAIVGKPSNNTQGRK